MTGQTLMGDQWTEAALSPAGFQTLNTRDYSSEPERPFTQVEQEALKRRRMVELRDGQRNAEVARWVNVASHSPTSIQGVEAKVSLDQMVKQMAAEFFASLGLDIKNVAENGVATVSFGRLQDACDRHCERELRFHAERVRATALRSQCDELIETAIGRLAASWVGQLKTLVENIGGIKAEMAAKLDAKEPVKKATK